MKLSYVLLNVVLVAAGIFLYDTTRGSPNPVAPAGQYDPLQADDVGLADERAERVVMLDGGGEGILAKRNANRLDDLETQIALLTRRREGGERTEGPRGVDAPPLALEEPDYGPEGEATNFDEPTLKAIEQYVDEINRRKMVERQRNRVAGELSRLGVDLTEEQQGAVVDLTLTYQQKARDLLQRNFTRDEKGREERKQAYDQLREEYTTSLNRLVPTAEAEKISASRLSRALGFSPGVFGGRRAGDRGTRRNRGDR